MEGMTLIETRKLYRDDLKRLCINKNWYTAGTNESYRKLLHMADSKDNITAADIVSIANDIYNNSELKYLMPLESVCFEIAETCHSYFEEID